MKLQTRVARAVVAVTVLTLSTASVIAVLLVRSDELADLDRALIAQARLAARVADMEDPRHPVLETHRAGVPEHYDPLEPFIVVYGPAGKVRTSTPNFGDHVPLLPELGLAPSPPPRVRRYVDLRGPSEALRGVVVPMPANGYSLLFAASRREVDTDVTFLGRILAVLLLAAGALTTVIASFIGKRLARDVSEIAALARVVARGDLDARVSERAFGSLETRALAADLDHMVEQLSALVAAQRTFVSHAAHELRSPLATLRGELQLALRRPHSLEENVQTIALALKDVEALVTLSHDLLTLARAETAEPGVSPPEALTGDILDDAARLSRAGAGLRGVRVSVSGEDDPLRRVRVRGAARELARAVRNLIDNAVAHSAAGGTVRIALEASKHEVRIGVEDGGPGVPASDRAHIFDPFFRGARDRGETDQGAGLGLAIARQIARRAGGDVELDPRFEAGARFVLCLPRVTLPN